MWFNSDIGVSRFNGYEFKNFNIENGLADNTIFGIYEDRKNRIWFRSMSGKLSYFENDKISVLQCNDALQKLIGNYFVTSIYIDSGDTIWLGTTDDCYLKIKPDCKIDDVQKIKFTSGKYIVKLDDTGFIFGGRSGKHDIISVYDKNRFNLFNVDPDFITELNDNQRFYVSKLKNGTYLASVGNKLINFRDSIILKTGSEKSIVINTLEDSYNTIVVGSYMGVSIYENNYLEAPKVIAQLNNKVITGLCQDKEDGFWITTEGHGIYYISHRTIAYFTTENGISESKISCMGIHDSDIVIGHIDGTLNILHENFVTTVSKKSGAKKNAQTSRNTSISNYGNKTIVTSVNDVSYLDKTGLTELSGIGSGAKRFIKSNDGNLWALYFNTICKFDLRNQFKKMDGFDPKIRTDNIYEDADNNLWVCCINGIHIYKNKKFKYLGEENELFKYRTSNVLQKGDGSLWFATMGGGVVVKRKNKIIQITEKEGLVGNICKSLLIDSNTVWVGTNKGLSKICLTQSGNYTIENFYAKNGLLTNEVNSILKHNNKLWLAHNNGITVLDANGGRSNNFPPPVYIEQMRIGDSLYKKEDLLNLKYDQNYITINYIGLSYKDAGNIEYKYKMEGIDSNWNYTRYTAISYHTIPPGSYRFLVAAKNNDGYWSSTPAIVAFKISPPWWRTWVFILFVITVSGLLIGFLFKYRLSTIKQKERLKAIQQTKLSNAELKALRAQMNPHFVFNAINSVQYFITNNDPASSQKYLSKFAKLIRYVVDNSKPSTIPLSKELDALNLYLDLESLRFENKFEYKVEVNDNVDIENIKIPSMLIQPYVENAIWHGLMHKTTKGNIKIDIKKSGNVLICFVEDNGIGRKKAQQILKEKNNEFHRSVGMSLTQERLDVISQQNGTKLMVAITDLEDAEGNGIGTRVELNLPFY